MTVLGPGENPLKPGEIAVRVGVCMECGGKTGHSLFEALTGDFFGIDAWTPEDGDAIRWGHLCAKHTGMAQYRRSGMSGEVEVILE